MQKERLDKLLAGYPLERFFKLIDEFKGKEEAILKCMSRIQGFREVAALLDCTLADVALIHMLKHVQAVTDQVRHRK